MGKIKYIVLTFLAVLFLVGCEKPKEVVTDNESMEEFSLKVYQDISLNQQKESNTIEFLTEELGEPLIVNKYIGSSYAKWLIGNDERDMAVLEVHYKDDVPSQAMLTFTEPHEQPATKKEIKQKIETIPVGKKMSLDSLMTLFGMPRTLKKIHEKQGLREYYEFDHNIDQNTRVFIDMLDGKVEEIEEKNN